MPGPPPKRARSRRNDPKKDFRSLPASGRVGAAPRWPLQDDVRKVAELDLARDRIASLQVELAEAEDGRTKGRLRRRLSELELVEATLSLQLDQARDAEVALWDELWSTPQAVMWEESHAAREVAQYVRWKIRAEQGEVEPAKEARQLADRLGLTPLSLLRIRVEVERAEEAETRGRRRREQPIVAPKDDDGDDPRAGLYAVS